MLWLGPDEWLLLATEADGAKMIRAFNALGRKDTGSLVDIGHRNFGLIISGQAACQLLNAGCPLDLDLKAFPVGMCTRTLFAKAGIVLWRTGDDRFHIEADRSYAPYLVGVLSEAMRDVT